MQASSCEPGVGWAVGDGISLGLPGKEGPGRFLEPGSSGGGPGVSRWTGNPNPKVTLPGRPASGCSRCRSVGPRDEGSQVLSTVLPGAQVSVSWG